MMLKSTGFNLPVSEKLSEKFRPRWLGPFSVLAQEGPSKMNYRLKLPPTMKKIHPVFHVVKIAALCEEWIITYPASAGDRSAWRGIWNWQGAWITLEESRWGLVLQYFIKWEGYPEAEAEYISYFPDQRHTWTADDLNKLTAWDGVDTDKQVPPKGVGLMLVRRALLLRNYKKKFGSISKVSIRWWWFPEISLKKRFLN